MAFVRRMNGLLNEIQTIFSFVCSTGFCTAYLYIRMQTPQAMEKGDIPLYILISLVEAQLGPSGRALLSNFDPQRERLEMSRNTTYGMGGRIAQ